MSEQVCGIYVIRHKVSGKCYVGQSVNVARRWVDHKSGLSGLPALGSALRKHGVDAFDFEVLERCLPEELNEREAFHVASLGSLSPGGYNLRSGGKQRETVSEEARKKMSDAFGKSDAKQAQLRQVHQDPAVRAKMSERAKTSEKSCEQRKRLHADPEIQARRRLALVNSEKAKAQRARLHASLKKEVK